LIYIPSCTGNTGNHHKTNRQGILSGCKERPVRISYTYKKSYKRWRVCKVDIYAGEYYRGQRDGIWYLVQLWNAASEKNGLTVQMKSLFS